ncbi:MAG: phosphate ABC transporter permease PstA [Chloroflexota bacterium]
MALTGTMHRAASLTSRITVVTGLSRRRRSLKSGEYPPGSLFRRLRDALFLVIFLASVVAGMGVLGALLVDVLRDGLGWLDFQFLNSYPSRRAAESGIKAALFGTLWIMGLTALFTVPLGIAAAIYLVEFASNNRINRLIQLNISNLAGVPSIIYGLLGLAIFVQFFAMGRSVLVGALTMTLLILPIVIIAAQEAIRAVPSEFKDAAFAMGANRWQVVKTIVLPHAAPGILSGIILALSRAIGEAAPMITISSLVFLTFIPDGIGSRFTVMPIQIFTWVSLPQPEFESVASAGIIVLLILLLSMNSIAIYLRNKFQKRV